MAKLHLQGIYGELNAVEAQAVKKGDSIMWNFGYTSTVLEIVKETRTQIHFLLRSDDSGYTAVRKLGKTRLVVLA